MPIGLVVVARNDAAVIEKTILSARGMVDTVTVVVDEKSTDATREICQRLAVQKTIVAPLSEVMAEARNAAIELALARAFDSPPDYLLMLDPGDTVEGEVPTRLIADVYDVWVYEGAMRYPRIQLFRAGTVRYEGIRSDEPVAADNATRSVAPKLVYRRRESAPVNLPDHVDKLLARLAVRPEDAHAAYDLAQTYRDMGQVEQARLWFEKRTTMTHQTRGKFADPRTDEHRYLAMLEIAFLVEDDPESRIGCVMESYLRASEMRPMLAEPLFHLACYLREKGCASAAWHFARRAMELPLPSRGIVTDIEVYEWKAKAELAIEAWLLGDRGTANKLLLEIADGKPQYKEWAQEQLAAILSDDPPEQVPGWSASKRLSVAEKLP